jgi:hypothetical protein
LQPVLAQDRARVIFCGVGALLVPKFEWETRAFLGSTPKRSTSSTAVIVI